MVQLMVLGTGICIQMIASGLHFYDICNNLFLNSHQLYRGVGFLCPMRLSKSRRDHQRENERSIRVHLVISFLFAHLTPGGPTLTLSAPARILPHETASSGLAPESDPSYYYQLHS